MNEKDYLNHYWNYYLSLEERIININRYISFDDKNKNCFSNEIMGLLINVCCEIDIVFKLMLGVENDRFVKIDEYRKKICLDNKYLVILDEILHMKDFNLKDIAPFKNFDKKTPEWWKAYNGLKHNRLNSFNKANLENLLNALGALYILEIYYYKNEYYEKSKFINIPGNKSKIFITEILKPNFINGNELIIDINKEF